MKSRIVGVLAVLAGGIAAAVIVTGHSPANSLPLTKVSETSTKVTFSWVPKNVQGYLYLRDGVRVANTWDPKTSQVTFGKLTGTHAYEVFAVDDTSRGAATLPPPVTTTPTTTTTPAGTGCVANPKECNLPDTTNTGVPAGTQLTQSGPLDIEMPGTVWDKKDITGSVQVNASNTSFTNSKITSSGGSGAFAVRIGQGATNISFNHVEIAGKSVNNPDSIEAAIWNGYGGSLTMNATYFHNCADCLEGGGTVTESYWNCNGLYPGAHYECIYINNGTIVVNHSVLLNPNPQTAVIFGDVNLGGGGPAQNVMAITNNLLVGGGFSIYTNSGSNGVGTSRINVSNNIFGRCITSRVSNTFGEGGTACSGGPDGHGNWPDGGYFGWDSNPWCGANADQVWTGNVWENDRSQVPCKP